MGKACMQTLRPVACVCKYASSLPYPGVSGPKQFECQKHVVGLWSTAGLGLTRPIV